MSKWTGSVDDWADLPGKLARVTFHGAHHCLMAHAVQSAESTVSHIIGRSYTIRIAVAKNLSGIVPGKRAIVRVQDDHAQIVVDGRCEAETQRKAVAHEIGHVLVAWVSLNLLREGWPDTVPGDSPIESACDEFERSLCARLHYLYDSTPFNGRNKFPSLATLAESMGPVIREEIARPKGSISIHTEFSSWM